MIPEGLEIDESAERIRIAWENRRTRKDAKLLWFLPLFWLIWTPLTVFATLHAIHHGGFAVVWCLFGWAGTTFIPISLLQIFGREWIEIDGEKLHWGISGCFPKGGKTMPLSSIAEIRLGVVGTARDTRECILTLNVFQKARFPKRHLVGYWLGPEAKRLVFERLRQFSETRPAMPRFNDS